MRETFGQEAPAQQMPDGRIAQQAATIEVLRAMSASPGDPQPVFEQIVRRAVELCDAIGGAVMTVADGMLHLNAVHTEDTPERRAFFAGWPRPVGPDTLTGRAVLERRIIHIRDIETDPALAPAAQFAGARSRVSVPLLRDGLALGGIILTRAEPGGFSDSQVELLQTFAEQAVIAIGSAETYRALQTRTADLQESLDYQTATGDVLKIISRSTFDLQPVLVTLLATAARLCDAEFGGIATRDGEAYRIAATYSHTPEYDAAFRGRLIPADRGSVLGRAALEKRVVHVADIQSDPDFTLTDAVKLGGGRTTLGVPLLREGIVAGVIRLGRTRVQPFTDRQIELVRIFADQAVIAIENTRLLTEQREALEQQTATAEVLQVINASPGDLAPVFDAMLNKAMRLCEASFGQLSTFDGTRFHSAATHGVPPAYAHFRTRNPPDYGPGTGPALLLAGEEIVHVADLKAEAAYRRGEPNRRALVDLGGARTSLLVPLRKDGILLGSIHIYRQEVRLFSDKQIALLRNFAAQAVIAMENARLINEQREALEQQTATAEVLQVINASPGNLEPVFDAMLEKALRLCGSAFGILSTYDGEFIHNVAVRGLDLTQTVFLDKPQLPAPGLALYRIVQGEDVVQIADITDDEAYRAGIPGRMFIADTCGGRTQLLIALRKDGVLLGVFNIFRQEVRPFSDRQITLLENFAAQAVIAMENARLFNELRARTDELAQRQAELRVTFENMGDGVAMFDAAQRLVAWNQKFQDILDLPDGFLAEHQTFPEYIGYLAERGEYGTGAQVAEQVREIIGNAGQHRILERTRPNGKTIEIRNNPVAGGGFVVIYADITERKRNETAIAAARDAAEQAARIIEAAFRDLKTAQANLIQAEKMASLGQLTAGIAHEIKNPLNFVNNFAELSVDLLAELQATAAPGFALLTEEQRADIEDVSALLTGNLRKIAEHGKRADAIVRSMLEHSRGASGERRVVDINALAEEALNLAFHGARAQDPSFNITLERDYAEAIPPIELNPQDITRVLLNLFGNGFYAANKRARRGGEPGFEPVLRLTTRDLGDRVMVRVRDNGTGIPPGIREKLFQPFFTTKPAGEGTGLGLSITYDIVTQQHCGTIAVDSEVDGFSEFVIILPRRMFAPEETER